MAPLQLLWLQRAPVDTPHSCWLLSLVGPPEPGVPSPYPLRLSRTPSPASLDPVAWHPLSHVPKSSLPLTSSPGIRPQKQVLAPAPSCLSLHWDSHLLQGFLGILMGLLPHQPTVPRSSRPTRPVATLAHHPSTAARALYPLHAPQLRIEGWSHSGSHLPPSLTSFHARGLARAAVTDHVGSLLAQLGEGHCTDPPQDNRISWYKTAQALSASCCPSPSPSPALQGDQPSKQPSRHIPRLLPLPGVGPHPLPGLSFSPVSTSPMSLPLGRGRDFATSPSYSLLHVPIEPLFLSSN